MVSCIKQDVIKNVENDKDDVITATNNEILVDDSGRVIVNIDTTFFDDNYVSETFVYPVNHGENLNGYTEAFGFFQKNRAGGVHLGTDISKPGEEDFGDTLYSISNGRVILVLADILMVLHKTEGKFLVSVYRHCNEIFVKQEQYINAAQTVGTIGNCNGTYTAHLHLELRNNTTLKIETGYAFTKQPGYLNPIKFIKDYSQEVTKKRCKN